MNLAYFSLTLNRYLSARSSIVFEVMRTILSQCIFFTKRYCTHKNTHKQKSTNKTKINLTLNNKSNNFSRVQTPKRMKVAYFVLAYKNV